VSLALLLPLRTRWLRRMRFSAIMLVSEPEKNAEQIKITTRVIKSIPSEISSKAINLH
jgi:hypothetical protein